MASFSSSSRVIRDTNSVIIILVAYLTTRLAHACCARLISPSRRYQTDYCLLPSSDHVTRHQTTFSLSSNISLHLYRQPYMRPDIIETRLIT
jgi:hypothetical protein